MKLSNSERDKRIIRILIPFGIVFSFVAAISGNGVFLFSLVSVGSFWLMSKALLRAQWYASSAQKYNEGEFRLFPLVQLLIIIPGAIACGLLGFSFTSLLENVL